MNHSPCPLSPTGSHHRLMEWRDMPDGRHEYWGVCKFCGDEKQEDASLGETRLNKVADGTKYFRGRKCELRVRGKGARE